MCMKIIFLFFFNKENLLYMRLYSDNCLLKKTHIHAYNSHTQPQLYENHCLLHKNIIYILPPLLAKIYLSKILLSSHGPKFQFDGLNGV